MDTLKVFGHRVIVWLEILGLLVIAVATVIAVGSELTTMFKAGVVTLADLLMLFIYLEVLAMVAIYLDSGKLPVRIPLYIAIVALARYMILDIKNLDTIHLLSIAGATLIIAVTVLVIRYGHNKLPYED
jgi:protein PsiE